MSREITVWAGPVNHAQNDDLRWPGTEAVYVTCTGDGSGGTPRCSEQATARPLSSVVGDASEIYGAAFSAGGQYWERVLTDPRIRGLYLADGTYSMWDASGKEPELATSKNRIDFAVKAAGDPSYRAVYTASSSPNKTSPSGSRTLQAIAAEVGKRVPGLEYNEREKLTVAGKTFEAKTWRKSGLLLADFGDAFTHTQMVTVAAPDFWRQAFEMPDVLSGARPDGSAAEWIDRNVGKVMIGIGILSVAAVAVAAMLDKKDDKEQP